MSNLTSEVDFTLSYVALSELMDDKSLTGLGKKIRYK